MSEAKQDIRTRPTYRGSADEPQAEYIVNDGRRAVGTILKFGKSFTAISSTVGQVGIFASAKEAMRAISQAHGAGAST